MTTNPRIARFRDAAIRRALLTHEGRTFFEEMRFRPSGRISTGLVYEPSSNPLVGSMIGQPVVFDLHNHRRVLLDELLGDGWSLVGVGLGASDEAWASAREVFAQLAPTYVDVPLDDTVNDLSAATHIAIDLTTELYTEFEAARGSFVLIRPDRVVAAVVTPDQFSRVVEALHVSAVPAGTH